jgi:Nucleotidyl transferase AbiEii toxin, Type IV TA system
MCFKGGTSLSKVFGLIQNEVTTKILPQLAQRFESVITKTGWELKPSPEAGEEMTLLFSYPNAFEYTAYVRPQIKIEFRRGDQWPSKQFPISPYVTEEFPDIFTIPNVTVPVLDCQRTFWEKVTLLHAEHHRPDPTAVKLRMSRHWSDIAVISTDETFATEKLDLKLLVEVVKFKTIYFASSWANYDSAFPGTMKLVPHEALRKRLREDYKAMREMFVDEPLSFDEIIARLKVLEARINALAKAS